LAAISPARLTEEFYKILHSGMAKPMFATMAKLKILDHFIPALGKELGNPWFNPMAKVLAGGLDLLDSELKAGKDPDRSTSLTFLVAPLLESQGWAQKATQEDFEHLIAQLKEWFKPIIPSNQELENALRSLFRVWAVRAPRKRPPRPRRRRSGGGEGREGGRPPKQDPKPM
jgi:tRNA nucleotidyltransferase/poly(A) polymerase